MRGQTVGSESGGTTSAHREGWEFVRTTREACSGKGGAVGQEKGEKKKNQEGWGKRDCWRKEAAIKSAQ